MRFVRNQDLRSVTPDDVFVHLAVTASGRTEWHGPVSDDDYASGHGGPPTGRPVSRDRA